MTIKSMTVPGCLKTKNICFSSLLCALMLSISTLHAEEQPAAPISFFDLPSASLLDGERVEIKGFLYRSREGEVILAKEPDLRTCCVGSKEKRNGQILVKGKIDSISALYPSTIQGRLRLSTPQGQGFAYTIEEGVVVSRQGGGTPLNLPLIVIPAAISCAALILIWYKITPKK